MRQIGQKSLPSIIGGCWLGGNNMEKGYNVVIRCQNKNTADIVKAEIRHKLDYDSDIVADGERL